MRPLSNARPPPWPGGTGGSSSGSVVTAEIFASVYQRSCPIHQVEVIECCFNWQWCRYPGSYAHKNCRCSSFTDSIRFTLCQFELLMKHPYLDEIQYFCSVNCFRCLEMKPLEGLGPFCVNSTIFGTFQHNHFRIWWHLQKCSSYIAKEVYRISGWYLSLVSEICALCICKAPM